PNSGKQPLSRAFFVQAWINPGLSRLVRVDGDARAPANTEAAFFLPTAWETPIRSSGKSTHWWLPPDSRLEEELELVSERPEHWQWNARGKHAQRLDVFTAA